MSSPAPTEPAALHVFAIPELAHLICDITRKRDNVNLMQACRKLFYCILPFVWEHVGGPDPLIYMIPGGGIIYHESELSPYAVMQLPGSLDLSRFNIYAAHVKRLTLSHVDVDAYDEWERFHSCTRSVDLLPNLEAIYFPAPHLSKSISNVNQVKTDAVNWAIAFLSSSLQTLVQAPPEAVCSTQAASPPWLDFNLFHSLISSVAKKCPNLRSLNTVSARGFRSSLVWFFYESPATYSSFAQLVNLTSLLISAVILCPEGLGALSNLPVLESLHVVGSEYNYQTYCDKMQLATGAFPALKHLELDQLTWSTIVNLCSAKPIISGLQSLSITYPQCVTSYPTNLSDIVPLLATHNSKISRLLIEDHQVGDPRVNPQVLQSWSRLPLVRLYLGWTAGHKSDRLCPILSCLPLLEELEFSRSQEDFHLGQLRAIIQPLPRLCRLQIPVSWRYATELTEVDFTPIQSLSNHTLYLKSGFYLSTPREENAKMVARYLSILRPLAPVICESFRTDSAFYDAGEPTSEEFKDMINAELSRLRGE